MGADFRRSRHWFPVTRLSHMLDSQFFGLRGGLHHLTSVWWHALAGVLLFAFLVRSTTRAGPAHGSLSYSRFIPARRIGRVGGGAQRRSVRLLLVSRVIGLRALCRTAGPGRYLAVLLWFILG